MSTPVPPPADAGSDPRTEDPALATFQFGPTYWLFFSFWLLGGLLPVALMLFGPAGSDMQAVFYQLSPLAIGLASIWGLTLWRARVIVTDSHVILRRLRKPIHFVRSDTTIKIQGVNHPMARISDGRMTRDSCSVTAMRRGSRKLRRLADYVPVTLQGKKVEPLGDGRAASDQAS